MAEVCSPFFRRKSVQRSESKHRLPLLIETLIYSTTLSVLFVLVYGWCNSMAAQRSDVDSIFFSWELRIPLVPILIVPYLSIDLFFVASFLICVDRKELHTHAARVAMAILLAGALFLAFPLRTGFPRPEVDGSIGKLFALLWSFDKPHNLAPSLHIALASLLWPLYRRHTRGMLRCLVHLWFALIVVSPLLVWQHHLFDVATGALLGQISLFVFPDRCTQWLALSKSPNLRVSACYAVGSMSLGVVAFWLKGWCWLALWPAVSLALMSFAYLRGSSAIFGKRDGRLPVCTRVVLGPYLLGAAARTWIYRIGRDPWTQAESGVYCGRLLTRSEARKMLQAGITGVLDVTAEHDETGEFIGLEYRNIPVLDLTQPSRAQLESASEFISKHAALGGVYVHCAIGISRSVVVTQAYRLISPCVPCSPRPRSTASVNKS